MVGTIGKGWLRFHKAEKGLAGIFQEVVAYLGMSRHSRGALSGVGFRKGTSFVDAVKTGPSMVNSSQHISNLDIVGDDGSDSSKMHV